VQVPHIGSGVMQELGLQRSLLPHLVGNITRLNSPTDYSML
jgi:hypothetical protein